MREGEIVAQNTQTNNNGTEPLPPESVCRVVANEVKEIYCQI